jgi:uncharacterized protein (TIGR02246 family)
MTRLHAVHLIRPIAKAASLAGLIVTAACTSAPAGMAGTDADAIRAQGQVWHDAANANDWAALMAVYIEDAVFMPPNHPTVRGHEEIQAFLGGLPPDTRMQLEMAEIDGFGDLAYARGTYRMHLPVPGMDEPHEDRGKYIEIWRRGADGVWRISRDIFNSDLPGT